MTFHFHQLDDISHRLGCRHTLLDSSECGPCGDFFVQFHHKVSNGLHGKPKLLNTESDVFEVLILSVLLHSWDAQKIYPQQTPDSCGQQSNSVPPPPPVGQQVSFVGHRLGAMLGSITGQVTLSTPPNLLPPIDLKTWQNKHDLDMYYESILQNANSFAMFTPCISIYVNQGLIK